MTTRFIAPASRPLQPTRCRWRRPGAQAAEPPVALLVVQNGVQQIGAPEVGPQSVRDVQLGVRDLPEQEIADAHFTRGPDQKIGIGKARRVEPRRDGLLIDAQIAQPSFHARVFDDRVERVHQFRPAAIVNRDVQPHAGVVRGGLDRGFQLLPHRRGKLIHSAHAS